MSVYVIGVTGLIASGKSTACGTLISHFNKLGINALHINTDSLFKEILSDDVVKKSLNAFMGSEVYGTTSHNIDEIISILHRMSPVKYGELCEMIGIYVRPYIMEKIESGCEVAILESATLFQTSNVELCNYVIEINTDQLVRFDRVITRDGNKRSIDSTYKLMDIQNNKMENKFKNTYHSAIATIDGEDADVVYTILKVIAFDISKIIK